MNGKDIAETLDGPVGYLVVGAVVIALAYFLFEEAFSGLKNLGSNIADGITSVASGAANAVGAIGQASADSAIAIGEDGEMISP